MNVEPTPENIRQQLLESVDEARWEWLQPHVRRDAVIMVDKEMDLIDVGIAIATDNTQFVTRWIEEQAIHKPTSNEIKIWNSDPSSQFKALIIDPYVLVQEC